MSFLDEFHDRPMPNIFLQFVVFLKREGILQFRYIRSLFLDMFLVLLAGGVLGGLYAEVFVSAILQQLFIIKIIQRFNSSS